MGGHLFDPLAIGRDVLTKNTEGLIYKNEVLYRYNGRYYEATSKDEIKSIIAHHLSDLFSNRSFHRPPRKADVEEVYEGLKLQILSNNDQQQFWLDASITADPELILNCKNCLLDLSTIKASPHNQKFFSSNGLNFDYQPSSEKPEKFFSFLDSIWPNDIETHGTLQEVMGLLLTNITKFQKAFLILGPSRSGKGTLIRLIQDLVGLRNITNPTFNNLSNQFGLTSMIGKQVAIVSDARITAKTDISTVIEVLLRITGEDSITIPRKYLSDWQGKLNSRFLICSNDIPAFFDTSNAISNRFVILQMTESFLGKEDLSLYDQLSTELPLILNWSIEGLNRLLTRGQFVQPSSGPEAMGFLKDSGSPLQSFVDECCDVRPDASIVCSALFDMWKNWCVLQNIQHAGTAQSFGRNLRSVVQNLRVTRDTKSTIRAYYGIQKCPNDLF